MKLTEMRQFLLEKDIQLTKSLGQNFLHDQHQLERIVQVAKLSSDDRVLEIGPGLGPLTERLIEKAYHVLAIEKDERLIPLLRQRLGDASNLELLHADALEWLKEKVRDWDQWKLVANLPYSVASPILVELAMGPRPPRLMVATLQWEVVQRLMAEADSEAYGLLTLLVQMSFVPKTFFKIPRGCFFPEPDVESACVVLERRAQPLIEDALRKIFVNLVKQSFSQRRKMMFKLLKSQWPETALRDVFERLQLDLQIRAEKVRVEQFAEMATILAGSRNKESI